MNVKLTKRILSGALAVALVMAPSVGVFASSNSGADKVPTVKDESVNAEAESADTYEEESTGTSSAAVETFKEMKTTSSAAGIQSQVSGAYFLQKGVGVAITTNPATIAQGYALAAGEKPYVKVFDMDVKKSNMAKASLDIAATAFGGTNVAFIQMELGKMSNGQYSLLPAGAGIAASFSIPKEALADGARYAVIRVVEGGAFTLLEDTDNDPATVSFVTTGGAGAYSIVRF